ncbi:MAG: hypothetical protein LBB14_03180 [Puniceicoccales bacterium]|jgi:hypothetical protein|nr:hypothetical protein [Puniceicoccales bacterium]
MEIATELDLWNAFWFFNEVLIQFDLGPDEPENVVLEILFNISCGGHSLFLQSEGTEAWICARDLVSTIRFGNSFFPSQAEAEIFVSSLNPACFAERERGQPITVADQMTPLPSQAQLPRGERPLHTFATERVGPTDPPSRRNRTLIRICRALEGFRRHCHNFSRAFLCCLAA